MAATTQPAGVRYALTAARWAGYLLGGLGVALIWTGLLSVARHPLTVAGGVAVYLLAVGSALRLRRGQIQRALAKLRATCLPPDPAVVALVQRLCPVDTPDVLMLPPPRSIRARSVRAGAGDVNGHRRTRKRRAEQPQAAALGGGHDAPLIVYTAALTARLTPVEQTAVLAHELAHLRHGDSHSALRARALHCVLLTLSLMVIGDALLSFQHTLLAIGWTWFEMTLGAAALTGYIRNHEARADRDAEALISDPAILGIALAEIDPAGTDLAVRSAVLKGLPGDISSREQLETSLAMAAAEARMRRALADMRPPRTSLYALLTLDHPPTTQRILEALSATAAASAADAQPLAPALAIATQPSSPSASRRE